MHCRIKITCLENECKLRLMKAKTLLRLVMKMDLQYFLRRYSFLQLYGVLRGYIKVRK